MNRVAALSADERSELFALTAERLGLGSAAVVEKDFWVCWILKQLFVHPELSSLLMFKGGTSLSKVYGLIDRFSEDVDLILDWRVVTGQNPQADWSSTKQNKLNRTINENAQRYIAESLIPLFKKVLSPYCRVDVQEEEKDLGHIVRVAYPETSLPGRLLPYIQLEIGPLASWLPNSKGTVKPYAADEFPDMFEEPLCPVRVIDAERTFWEKATILHHEANRPKSSPVPARYSRHYYDLYMMSQTDVKQRALSNLGILGRVVEFKMRFYPRGWACYDQAMPGTLKLIPPERILAKMRTDYDSMQEMIFGQIPGFDDIITGITKLENEINSLVPGIAMKQSQADNRS